MGSLGVSLNNLARPGREKEKAMFEWLQKFFGQHPKTVEKPINSNTERIHELEAQGFTAHNCDELHERNVAQTDAMSTEELEVLKYERQKAGKPTDKIEAALRNRENSKRIHELESQGHTASTSSELHSRNVARTNSMSTSQLQQTRAERIAQGKPVGQIDAALRDRGER